MSRSVTRTSGHATSLSIPLRSAVTASRSVRTITRRSMRDDLVPRLPQRCPSSCPDAKQLLAVRRERPLERLGSLGVVLEEADGLDEIGVVAIAAGSSAVVNIRYGVAESSSTRTSP